MRTPYLGQKNRLLGQSSKGYILVFFGANCLFVKYMTIIQVALLAIQLLYWHYFFKNLSIITKSDSTSSERSAISVSLIICVKNELENLKRNIERHLVQNHPDYELVIADDFSSDNTSDFVEKIDNETGFLKYYKVKQNKLGKKQALSEALAFSEHNWVLLTDADCRPASNSWITSMSTSRFSDKIRIILGYSPTESGSSWLSKWAHFETWLTALQYLSFASRGLPYMGVGRNMMYDKSLLTPTTLSRYSDLSSGDDDLTIMQIATKDNTTINLEPESYVYTAAPRSFSAYWKQKTRHYSTAISYKGVHIALLSGYSLSHVGFYVLLLCGLIKGPFLLSLGLYLLRLLAILPVVFRLKKRLKANFLLVDFMIFDLLQVFYYMIFSFAVLFPQKNKW